MKSCVLGIRPVAVGDFIPALWVFKLLYRDSQTGLGISEFLAFNAKRSASLAASAVRAGSKILFMAWIVK
jgi:hypothetical protein